MKKSVLTLLSMLFMHGLIFSQIIFFENFENGIPNNFTIVDVDGLTPHDNVSFMTKAWMNLGFASGGDNFVAASNSWYNPEGTADDWLITPLINLTTYSTLEWDAKANSQLADGYEVYVGTVNHVDSFKTLVPVFSIDEESTELTHHSIDISNFDNQSVYIAFRNNSTGKYLLAIDDIKVSRNAVSTEEITTKNNHLSAYPNPVIGLLQVSLEKPFSKAELKVYNTLGQLIETVLLSSQGVNTINTEQWMSGCYFLVVTENNQKYHQTIVKQ